MKFQLNSRGAYLTFLTFLLILSALSLLEVVNIAKTSAQKNQEINIFLNTEKTFADVSKNTIEFDKNGYAKTVDQRTVPFTYNIDGNKITVSETLPLSEAGFSRLFDEINYFRVFVTATDNNSLEDSTKVDLNTAKNKAWGGNDSNKISFLVNPFCAEMRLGDKNTFDLNASSDSNKCEAGDFNNLKILGFDVNVSLKEWNNDFNVITCNGTNCSPAFGGTANDPTINFFLDDSICSPSFCHLSDDNRVFSAHYLRTLNNEIIVCNSANCGTKQIVIRFGQGIKAVNKNTSIGLSVTAVFNDQITGFELKDANAAVSSKTGKNWKSNN